MVKHTSLYPQHLAANAHMVDFGGWKMPLNYGSQLTEHQAVRTDAGLFDVSHMTVVDLLGAGGRQLLLYLLANNVDRMAHPGQALYSCMLNQHGGILDDLIVYQRGSDSYRVVLNAGTRDKDLQWIRKQANGFSVGIQERDELAMVAVQGPQALAKLATVLIPAQLDAISTLQTYECVDVQDWFFARTGYTGEDGLEVILPGEQAADFWQALIKAGVQPCGLAARDTLRLEAGMLLYGQDMDETLTPLDCNLGWTVAWEPEDREFIGRDALMLQKQRGVRSKIVGLVLTGKGIMRTGQTVIVSEQEQGIITSGGFSPTLQKSIALARVPLTIADTCEVDIRGKAVAAQVVKPRFVKFGNILI
ncbi:MAG: glycine cleavage system aminomethyltransferase GcvT [Legionellales bacterium]|nr:glycine cleavage system aminomethyltransferase GcvT [Legionellales bacterium]